MPISALPALAGTWALVYTAASESRGGPFEIRLAWRDPGGGAVPTELASLEVRLLRAATRARGESLAPGARAT